MPRGWLLYLITVAVPASSAVILAGTVRSAAVESDELAPDRKAAEMAIALLQIDLQETTRSLLENAAEPDSLDLALPGVRAALDGDTVAGLGTGERAMRATLFAPGPDGTVLYAEEPFEPTFPALLEGSAGYEAALYLNGVRRASTDAGFGADALGSDVLERLSGAPGGIATPAGRGVLVPLEPIPGRPPSVVVLAARSFGGDEGTSLPLWLPASVLGLLVAGLGWWGLGRGTPGGTSVRVLLGLPLAVTWAVLLWTQWAYVSDVETARDAPLQVGAAVVPSLAPDPSAAYVREVTGYDAVILTEGEVFEAAPVPGPEGTALDALASAVAAGRGPGVVDTEAGRTRFATASTPRGTVVLMAPDDPVPFTGGPALRLLLIGAVATVVAAWFAALRPRPARAGSASS